MGYKVAGLNTEEKSSGPFSLKGFARLTQNNCPVKIKCQFSSKKTKIFDFKM
jgi:hypothetical protein